MKYPGWLTWLLLFFPLAACCQWDYVNPVATADNYTSLYFTDPATGFALTTHGTLMGTVDGGNSWTKIGNVFPSSVFFLDMTFTSPLEGTLTGGLGVILHTRNGGHAWDSVPSGTEANLQAVYMYSDSVGYIAGLHGTVLKTLNGGRSWTLVQTNLDRDLYDCWFVGPSTGFVAADKSVFRTLDGGTTWNQVLLADSGANFIRIAFADSLHGFTIGRMGAAYKTSDGGNTWIRTTTGTTRYLFGLSVVNPQMIFITGSGGLILKSTDSGETWVSLPCGFPYDLGSVFFTGENNGSATGPLGSILHTSDGGTSWNPSTFSTLKDLWDCSFTNLQTGFACGSEGTILKTRDGGERWSVMTSGTSQTLNAICMVTDRVGYSAGEGGVVLKTDDAGETWNTLQAPAAVSWHDILFLDADKGFLVGVTPLIYHTTDGGHTWNSCNTGTTAAINAIGCYGLSGYACGTNATLLQTKDGGVTWQQVVVPELCEANLNKISCINENVCYVIGNQYIDNAYTMFLAFTRDGGNTWQTKTFAFYPSKVFTSLFFTDGMTGYAGGTGFIWKTTDGFDHWIDQTMDLRQIGPNDLFFISDQVGFSVSYAGQILKTTNGGGIGIKEPGLVSSSLFSRNYPNPFSGKTRISYSLPVSGMVQLVICDATGREVSTLTSQVQAAGSYYFDFDGSGMPSGFYFYRLFSKGETATGKMVKN